MRIYDYLDGIKGALGSGSDNGVPTPSWRIEEYLKDIYDAIKAGGGGGGGGGGSDVMLVTVSSGNFDKKWQEVFDAMSAGTLVVRKRVNTEDDISVVVCTRAWNDSGYYTVNAGAETYLTESANDYPSLLIS